MQPSPPQRSRKPRAASSLLSILSTITFENSHPFGMITRTSSNRAVIPEICRQGTLPKATPRPEEPSPHMPQHNTLVEITSHFPNLKRAGLRLHDRERLRITERARNTSMSSWEELWRKEHGREIPCWTETIMNMHDGRLEGNLISRRVIKNDGDHPSPSACAPDPSLSDRALLRERRKRSSSYKLLMRRLFMVLEPKSPGKTIGTPPKLACQQVNFLVYERVVEAFTVPGVRGQLLPEHDEVGLTIQKLQAHDKHFLCLPAESRAMDPATYHPTSAEGV